MVGWVMKVRSWVKGAGSPANIADCIRAGWCNCCRGPPGCIGTATIFCKGTPHGKYQEPGWCCIFTGLARIYLSTVSPNANTIKTKDFRPKTVTPPTNISHATHFQRKQLENQTKLQIVCRSGDWFMMDTNSVWWLVQQYTQTAHIENSNSRLVVDSKWTK